MNSVFEKIIEKLEAYSDADEAEQYGTIPVIELDRAIEIVKQEAYQYNNGWISCIERLPEESGEYLTWVEYDGDRFIAIDEIDCDGIIKEWNCSTDYKIIAWQQLPQPYQPKGEQHAKL